MIALEVMPGNGVFSKSQTMIVQDGSDLEEDGDIRREQPIASNIPPAYVIDISNRQKKEMHKVTLLRLTILLTTSCVIMGIPFFWFYIRFGFPEVLPGVKLDIKTSIFAITQSIKRSIS